MQHYYTTTWLVYRAGFKKLCKIGKANLHTSTFSRLHCITQRSFRQAQYVSRGKVVSSPACVSKRVGEALRLYFL